MALLDTARSLGLSRGVFGDSRPWLIVGGIAWGIRAISWARAPRDTVVFREALEPGETLVLTHTGPPPTRGEHRRSRRAERKLARRDLRRRVAVGRMRHRHRVL
jgi:hypothetical protein